MGVRIRMQRQGRCNRPHFRIVVTDIRSKQGGQCLEVLGHHDPLAKSEDVGTKVNLEAAQKWMSVGAQCSKAVADILRRKGMKLPVLVRVPKAQRKGKDKRQGKPAQAGKKKDA